MRHPGTNCRHRVRRTLRHVHSAQHERLHRVRQLHCQGLYPQCRLPTASRVSRMTSGHRITRHDLSEGGGRITSALSQNAAAGPRPSETTVGLPLELAGDGWEHAMGNLRPPRTQSAEADRHDRGAVRRHGPSPGQAGAPERCAQRGCRRCLARARPWSPIWSFPAQSLSVSPARGCSTSGHCCRWPSRCTARCARRCRLAGSLRVWRDCSVLLAAVPAVRDVAGRAGLLFVDGHEDATPMDLSLSGEAANMEIALLLGLTGERAPQPLRDWLPALARDAIAMLGPRDHLFRQAANVPTVADRVWLRSADEVSADPPGYARMAIEHVAAHASRWWLHIDLDVLARSEFSACGAPGEVSLAGGLTWRQLTQISASALQAAAARAGACRSITRIWIPTAAPRDASSSSSPRSLRSLADSIRRSARKPMPPPLGGHAQPSSSRHIRNAPPIRPPWH